MDQLCPHRQSNSITLINTGKMFNHTPDICTIRWYMSVITSFILMVLHELQPPLAPHYVFLITHPGDVA